MKNTTPQSPMIEREFKIPGENLDRISFSEREDQLSADCEGVRISKDGLIFWDSL